MSGCDPRLIGGPGFFVDPTGATHPYRLVVRTPGGGTACICATKQEAVDHEWHKMWSLGLFADPWVVMMVKLEQLFAS